jgi:hypothetical protein
MMKYIRIFLEWVKNLFLNAYDDLTRPGGRPALEYPVVLVIVVITFVGSLIVARQLAHTMIVIPTIPVHTAGATTKAADPLILQADLCSGRPRQFVLNLDGTQISLSIQE